MSDSFTPAQDHASEEGETSMKSTAGFQNKTPIAGTTNNAITPRNAAPMPPKSRSQQNVRGPNRRTGKVFDTLHLVNDVFFQLLDG